MQLVGSIIMLAANPEPISKAASAMMIVNAVSSMATNIGTEMQADRSIAEKLSKANNEAASVSGSDDVDLMSYYAKNRAKLCVYQVNDTMKDLLWKLFYYTGYAVAATGIPNTTSRIWFNYIQADVVFDEEDESTVYYNYLADIKTRYASGVTVYHQRTINNKAV